MSASVQVFGRRDDEAIHAHLRPASEKRQGTKSREVGSGGAAGAMGILPRARAREGWSGAVAANGFPPSMGGCVGVNERSAGGAPRLVARLVVPVGNLILLATDIKSGDAPAPCQ